MRCQWYCTSAASLVGKLVVWKVAVTSGDVFMNVLRHSNDIGPSSNNLCVGAIWVLLNPPK